MPCEPILTQPYTFAFNSTCVVIICVRQTAYILYEFGKEKIIMSLSKLVLFVVVYTVYNIHSIFGSQMSLSFPTDSVINTATIPDVVLTLQQKTAENPQSEEKESAEQTTPPSETTLEVKTVG